MNPRKGLKRLGMRKFALTGPRGTQIIERERATSWLVYPKGWPTDPRGAFFVMKFPRLHMARAHADAQAGKKQ